MHSILHPHGLDRNPGAHVKKNATGKKDVHSPILLSIHKLAGIDLAHAFPDPNKCIQLIKFNRFLLIDVKLSV